MAADEPPVPGGYTLVRELSNRAGRVLHCQDAQGHEVVVRVLAGPAEPSGASAQESELRSLAAAGDHACAVRVTRVWTDSALGLCVEQEYCPGGSLTTLAPVAQSDALVGTARLGAALAQLHAHGLLHRDVRSDNVLIGSDGEWRLTDAGIASVLGLAAGSDAHLPRELLGWEAPGPAADVFGLGAVLHTALTGQPVGAPDGVTDGAPLPASTPPILGTLIARMLAPDPAERPALTEIDQVLRSLVPGPDLHRIPPPVPARPLSAAPRPKVRGLTEPPPAAAARRRGVFVAVGAAVLFFAGAGAVIATDGGADQDPAELAAAAGVSPSPTVTPSATPIAASPSNGPKTAPKAAPKASPKAPKLRGTGGTATGPDVTEGLTPRQYIAFVYRGRLAVLFDMEQVSKKIKRFEIYSAQPDGSRPARGADQPGDIDWQSVPLRQAYFFEPDVALDRCVQIRVTLESGRRVPDSRTVCPVELTGADLRDADNGWAGYLRYLAEKNATARPTNKPGAGRDT